MSTSVGKTSFKVQYGYKEGQIVITLRDKFIAGKGTFGVVYGSVIDETNTQVAIKKVLQDSRYKNRELQILKMLQHHNIVNLLYYFKQKDEQSNIYLHLIMEYFPQTILEFIRQTKGNRSTGTVIYIKLFAYQMMRGLAYMHSKNVSHRDIKPTNLLINMEKGVLKICDFGSAKMLMQSQPNVAYICSRYYRAPELVLGAVSYGCPVDVWSAGCVIAEMVLGRPIFPGENSMDQMVQIIRVLNCPNEKQLKEMNSQFTGPKWTPVHQVKSLSKIFYDIPESSFITLLQLMFDYSPSNRLTAIESLVQPFFDDLRKQKTKIPSNLNRDDLFNFSNEELRINPSLNKLLLKQI